MFRNSDVRSVALLLGFSLLLWLPRFGGPIDLRYDAGVYYILGTSLAEGRGYRLLSEPGDIQAIQYPPLLPAFVAAHEWVLGTGDPAVVGPWLRRSFCLIFILYVQAVYALARQWLAPAHALLVGLATGLYLHSFYLSDLLFAEIPFALVTALFVLLSRGRATPTRFALTALLGTAAYLLRTAGVALFAAWVLESLLRRRWQQAALRTAVALLPVVLWQLYISRVTSGEEYRHAAYAYQRAPYQYYNVSYLENILLVDPFIPEQGQASAGGLVERVGRNLALMAVSLGEGVTAGRTFWTWLLKTAQESLGIAWLPPWVALIPITLVGVLVAVGVGAWLARGEWLIPLYLAASVGLICLTPWPGQFTRYLTPLTPFLVLSLVRLLVSLRRTDLQSVHQPDGLQIHPTKGRRLLRWCPLPLVMTFVLGTEVITDLHAFKYRHEHGRTYAASGEAAGSRLFFYDEKWAAFDQALAWLKKHARPGEVVATSAPHRAYLKTGLKAVMPPMEVDPDQADQLLAAVPARYVVVDELDFVDITRRYALPAVRGHPERWRLAYRVPDSDTCVYQAKASAPRGAK